MKHVELLLGLQKVNASYGIQDLNNDGPPAQIVGSIGGYGKVL